MKNRFRRRLFYTLLLFGDALFLLIPYAFAVELGKFIGFFGYLLGAKQRRLAKEHLNIAFGASKTDKEIEAIARSSFMNIGMGLMEFASLPKIGHDLNGLVDVVGIKKIDDALKEGKGVIVVSAHLGNWEFIPMYFAGRGYPANVVARPIYYEKYDQWVMSIRNRMGVNVIYRTDSPKLLIDVLRKNQLLGIVADQDIDSIEGVFVDFFEKKAYTPTAPVKLAMLAGCPIIPMFIVRSGKRHTIHVGDPIRIEKSMERDAAVSFYTQKWSDAVESYVRRYPDQWVWMHRRWKTQPGKTA